MSLYNHGTDAISVHLRGTDHQGGKGTFFRNIDHQGKVPGFCDRMYDVALGTIQHSLVRCEDKL